MLIADHQGLQDLIDIRIRVSDIPNKQWTSMKIYVNIVSSIGMNQVIAFI